MSLAMNAASLFSNIPDTDALQFGMGAEFKPELVSKWLDLRKADVAKVADVSPSSVRYDKNAPAAVVERLQEIAITINLVAKIFDGDVQKTAVWFKAKNPNLGDISPRDMVRLGRFDRLRKVIVNAMADPSNKSVGTR